LDNYSQVIKTEFQKIKESIESLSKPTDKIEEGSNSEVEELRNKVSILEGYLKYIAKNLDKNISYSKYLAENQDKGISYMKHLAENLDKNISYVKYVAENLDANIT